MAIPYSMLRDQLEQRLRQVAGAYANRSNSVRSGQMELFADSPTIERATQQGYEFPLGGEVAWHSSPGIERGGVIDLERTDLGFHTGSLDAAVHRARDSMSPYSMSPNPNDRALGGGPFRPPTFVDVVATPGREIVTPDLDSFSTPGMWRKVLENDSVDGLEKKERDHLLRALGKLNNIDFEPTTPNKRRMLLTLLRELGIDRVRYTNAVEDAGSESIMFLNPDRLRWLSQAKFDPERLGENGLTLGVGGITVAEALRRALEEDNP